MKTYSLLRALRITGLAEGVSFLLLLLIAMPLKYMLGKPEAVTYTGWAHGVLFVAYWALAAYAKEQYGWKWTKLMLAMLAALLPLGTFFYDRQLKRDEENANS
ncbi:MAG: DUF3817 domain-containing protein [Chitinophagaceae bacterium]